MSLHFIYVFLGGVFYVPNVMYILLIISFIYFNMYAHVYCFYDTDKSHVSLSVFDSPEFLSEMHQEEISLYHTLMIYSKSLLLASHALEIYHRSQNKVYTNSYDIFLSQMRRRFYKEMVVRLKQHTSESRRQHLQNISFYSMDTPENMYYGALLGLLIIQDTYAIDINLLS